MTANHTQAAEPLCETRDLSLFWRGRSKALRILDSQRHKSDPMTLETARVYDECAAELDAALNSASPAAASLSKDWAERAAELIDDHYHLILPTLKRGADWPGWKRYVASVILQRAPRTAAAPQPPSEPTVCIECATVQSGLRACSTCGSKALANADGYAAFVEYRDKAIAQPPSGEREALEATLFAAIAHGDAEHRAWLEKAISDHFAGKKVERPRGLGRAAAAEKALREIHKLAVHRGTFASVDTRMEHAEHALTRIAEFSRLPEERKP